MYHCENCTDKNLLKQCKCGCTKTITERDSRGRRRLFVVDHQNRKVPTYCENCCDENWLVECGCGCGKTTVLMSRYRKKRVYLNGHASVNMKHPTGNYRRGEYHQNWKGGVIRAHGGYLAELSPGHPRCNRDGYVQQHILVVEKHLGRHLRKYEVVHHINEIKNDNRLENLQVLTNSEHMRITRQSQIMKEKKKLEELRTKSIAQGIMIVLTGMI